MKIPSFFRKRKARLPIKAIKCMQQEKKSGQIFCPLFRQKDFDFKGE